MDPFPIIRSRNADSQQYILTILIADNNSSIALHLLSVAFAIPSRNDPRYFALREYSEKCNKAAHWVI